MSRCWFLPSLLSGVRYACTIIPSLMICLIMIRYLRYIVCPKEASPQGVLFIQKRISEIKTSSKRPWHYITGKGIFFPLPESARESEAKFPLVSPDWNQVRYVYVSPGVEAEFFSDPDFQGRSLSLPCADCGPQPVFDLQTFGFYDARKSPGVISSLSVRALEKK